MKNRLIIFNEVLKDFINNLRVPEHQKKALDFFRISFFEEGKFSSVSLFQLNNMIRRYPISCEEKGILYFLFTEPFINARGVRNDFKHD